MSYTTPPTFFSGDPLAASDLNILGDDIAYLKAIADGVSFTGAKVTRAAATSISSATDSPVTWTAESYDYGSWWSSGTDVVVPSAAVPAGFTTIALLVHGRVLWAANGAGYRAFKILQNGTAIVAPTVPGFASDTAVLDFTGIIVPASAADVFTVDLYQNSGGSLNASSISLQITRLAPVA